MRDSNELPEKDRVRQQNGGCGGDDKEQEPERRADNRTHARRYVTQYERSEVKGAIALIQDRRRSVKA